MATYTVSKSDGSIYASIPDEEVLGPVGFPTQSDVYFSSPLAILSISLPNTFQVTGNRTTRLVSGFPIKIIGSAGNNGTYTVASSSYNGTRTTVVIQEAFPSSSDPKGFLTYQVPVTGAGALPRTSLTLFGQSVINYGDYIAENFLHLLENFSGSNAPPYAIPGQLWYDTTSGLKVFDGSAWVAIGAGSGSSSSSGASPSASYITLSPDASLTSERVLIGEPGVISIADGGSTVTLGLASGSVTTPKLGTAVVTTLKIADGNVTLVKLQTIPTATILGRGSAGSGSVEALTISSQFAATSGGLSISPSAFITAIPFSCSDETTLLTTGVKGVFRMPYGFVLTKIKASLTTAATTLMTIDVKRSGTSVFSTPLTIDANETSSSTAATNAVISITSIADDAEISISVSLTGSGGAGLKVYLIGYRQ